MSLVNYVCEINEKWKIYSIEFHTTVEGNNGLDEKCVLEIYKEIELIARAAATTPDMVRELMQKHRFCFRRMRWNGNLVDSAQAIIEMAEELQAIDNIM
ncbi:hypothetical protein R6242_16295 [Iodobacter sp. CM08]|uniref:hypothetical protein n=1 Tax=Iodobacter sp. CM08 TaxID=3085902 RepID=UPI002981C404|nr:hypothetical protein [Iodobacter sp. CM08]MDW5418128.1 hypothetical protein [Iodobacter sp. CM08]